jgi:DNA-binding IclR family transcriptional regulator
MTMGDAPVYRLNSVDLALRLIQLMHSGAVVRIQEAADYLGVSPSTAHRVLAMLVYRGFAERDAVRRYRGGPALSRMPAAASRSSTKLLLAALGPLQDVVAVVDETAFAHVLRGHDATIVLTVESSHALRVGDRSGVSLPAHMTSGGRAMLAALSDEELATLYAGARTVVDMAGLRATIAQVRSRGYATNVAEAGSGFHALGVPVVTATGEIPCAISLAVPDHRYRTEAVPAMVALLRRATRAIATALPA